MSEDLELLKKFKYHPSQVTLREANRIVCNMKLSDEFMEKYCDNFFKIKDSEFIYKLIQHQNLPHQFIVNHIDEWKSWGWKGISQHQHLTESFIREIKDYVHWSKIVIFQNISDSFLEEFKDRIDWNTISNFEGDLSEEFIDKYKDYLNWHSVCTRQILSEQFMRDHIDYLDWSAVSFRQEITDKFIEDFKDKVDWGMISSWYKAKNEEFIDKWKKYINWHILTIDYHWSFKQLMKYRNYINFKTLLERHMGAYNTDKIKKEFKKELIRDGYCE